MSVGLRRSTPPPPRAVDWTGAEQRRARRLWQGHIAQEVSEDELIGIVLAVEFADVKPDQRGIYRADAKATLSWLLLARVIAQVEPAIFKFAESFPAWPQRSVEDIQARDARARRDEDEAQLRQAQEAANEDALRHNPTELRFRGLENALNGLRGEIEGLRAEMRALARRRDGESTVAALDEKLKAARQGRDTSPPVEPGEEGRTHEQPAEP